MFYWVIQEVGGQIYIHGPWKTQEARDKRFEGISGGEVHKFNSFSSDQDTVRKEFMDERAKKAFRDL